MRARSVSRTIFVFSILCFGEMNGAFAQEVINGDLTVNGTVEINQNNVFLGLAETWDGSALKPAFGLTINYTESPPTTGYSSAGHSTPNIQPFNYVLRVCQEVES